MTAMNSLIVNEVLRVQARTHNVLDWTGWMRMR